MGVLSVGYSQELQKAKVPSAVLVGRIVGLKELDNFSKTACNQKQAMNALSASPKQFDNPHLIRSDLIW
jgi:hypothetical protein